MDTKENQDEAVELLQQLGLKEYEAKCFVGLTRADSATAKDLSEITEVPRTRVYDAIRVLEAQGLVEVQHSSPQRFRGVSIEEATETLRDQFEDRIERLQESLRTIEPVEMDAGRLPQEVWALSGNDAIANRTRQLVEEATEEVVLVVGETDLLSDELFDTIRELPDDVTVIVGAMTDEAEEEIQDALPGAEVFVSGLDWLHSENVGSDSTAVGRLLLIDRETLLVSSYEPGTGTEHAVFGTGFGNGLVVITRRLMETGLLTSADPRTG